jgi:LysM repeat protein
VRAASGSAVVTVQAGDSLWVIAQRVAPTRDPRDEVAQLRKLNHLTSDTVDPGQSLRVR